MVSLNWKNKVDITPRLDKLKEIYKSQYEQIELMKADRIKNLKKNEWYNRLYWGDNFCVLSHLLSNFKEKIDLIYIDPPFFSGANYNITVEIDGEKTQEVAYHDKWQNNIDSYLQMLYERIILLKELLSEKGLLFIHLDWHASHHIRLIMDEVFGEGNFINNIVWYYYNKYSAGKRNLPRAHDDILVYAKTDKYELNEIRIPRKKPRRQLKRVMVDGVLKNAKDENGKVIYRIVKDKKADDVWRIPCMQPASKKWTGYPTQKHHDLLERIIKMGSNKDDLVADFFCGSGTTLSVAQQNERRWIGSDISEYSIYVTINRIMKLLKKKQKTLLPPYPFRIFADLDESKDQLISSGFFSKEISIKRN